jgi:hypothetical protein
LSLLFLLRPCAALAWSSILADLTQALPEIRVPVDRLHPVHQPLPKRRFAELRIVDVKGKWRGER